MRKRVREEKRPMRVWLSAVLTIVLVVITSTLSVSLWGEKEETVTAGVPLQIRAEMTVAEFGAANALDKSLMKEVFSLASPEQLQQPLTAFGLTLEEIAERVHKKQALAAEEASKNWFKIPLKFCLWFLFMISCFVLLRRRKITRRARLWLYAAGFTIFGVMLGADPSPMGTVKDAIVLYAAKGFIFKPRMIAFSVFILTVVLANKFICSWGCQLGALQDFLFRLNRNGNDTGQGRLPQFRIPFLVSNAIRILFLVALILVALTLSYDITSDIDPFKIFKPMKMSLIGWFFVAGTLVLSLFVYRPWCHLFCPFGLVGWLFEKLSIFRVKVDYSQCIACQACAKTCPSAVMGAILKRDRMVIPDCFSCGNCVESCPTGAVRFAAGKRDKPPAGLFGD